MTLLAIALALLLISFAALTGYILFIIKYRNGYKGSELTGDLNKTCPFVSILIPLKNVDDGIEKNLESIFQQDYPGFEIIFGVDSLQDPIVDVISSLPAAYPTIPARIIETGHSSVENPKIHKLALMANKAVGALYWVSDSNIRVEKNTLKSLVHEYLEKDSKIIFSPIRATGSRTIGSIIENTYINLFLSGNIIAAWKLFKEQIVVGKSILIEKNSLDYFGGFSYFKDYLAEDYMMGKAFTRSKIPISTNFTWITNFNSNTTIRGFFARAQRWAKLRFHLKLHVYLMEVLLNPIMLALIFSLILGGIRGLVVFGSTLLLKILLEFINFLVINKGDRKKISVILALPFCILLKDILLFAVYFTPFFSKTVKWRGGKISIGKNTLISTHKDNHLLDGV